jgi:hypothetical protein
MSVVPEGSAQLVGEWRTGAVRATLRHGVGVGYLATPGLFDAAELAFTKRFFRRLELHADGGLWRSGSIPSGGGSTLAYGFQGEIAWVFGNGLRLGVGGSRFARVDSPSTAFNRNIFGLRLGWELRRRPGRE